MQGGVGHRDFCHLEVGVNVEVVWLCGYDQDFIESWIANDSGARRSGDLDMGEEDSDEEEELDLEFGMEGHV